MTYLSQLVLVFIPPIYKNILDSSLQESMNYSELLLFHVLYIEKKIEKKIAFPVFNYENKKRFSL